MTAWSGTNALSLDGRHIAKPVHEDYKRTTRDGAPFLGVFLDHTQFVWSGNVDDPIEVEDGAAGEPLTWLIFIEPWSPPKASKFLAGWFARVCRDFLNARHEAEAS